MKSISSGSIAADVESLGKLMGSFDSNSTTIKVKLLKRMAKCDPMPVDQLISYHDRLLFISAYPDNAEVLMLANRELERVGEMVKEIFSASNERRKTQLTNTGIANSQLNVCFSFDLVKWLEENFPDQVSIFSCDAEEETIKSFFFTGLLRAEADRFREKNYSLQQFIRLLKPDQNISELRWLLNFIDQIPASFEIRDHLYDSLKIFISISLNENVPSLGTARSLPGKIFYQQKELLKKFDPEKVLRDKKIKRQVLTKAKNEELIKIARMTLCCVQREIDPVTYANAGEVELFDMGRGIDIALFPMIHEKKLSLESYIGYMAFKNRIPIAYGGGWIFLFNAKIGINIFPPLRGGESSYLFCQILRLYHLHFNVSKFIVEPYQIGKNNTEGLKSGAYWFYYRLGFRSVQQDLRETAEKEFQKISENKKYRSPISVMKKLATSNLELDFSSEASISIKQPDAISSQLSQLINTKYKGRRKSIELHKSFLLKNRKTERNAILEMQRLAKKDPEGKWLFGQ